MASGRVSQSLSIASISTISPDEASVELSPAHEQTLPLVLSVPHAGRIYPTEFLDACSAPIERLQRTEDRFIDQLVREASSELGARTVIAKVARTYVDLNRAATDQDPALIGAPASRTTSHKARFGFGVVPRKALGGTSIYDHEITQTEVDRRLAAIWHPYHQTLEAAAQETIRRFGRCLTIDCHSMPSLKGAQIVLGDCHGESASQALIETADAFWTARGYRVSRNHPYAGGYITAEYGRPNSTCQALQLELDRDLYLERDGLTRLPVERTRRLIGDLREFFCRAIRLLS